jgi:hypothetical protein
LSPTPSRTASPAFRKSFAKWEQLLSPKEYLLVEVRTSDGMRQAMLLPKATLKAAWEADPLRKALVVNHYRVRKA